MSSNVASMAGKSNPSGARACTISRKGLHTNLNVMRVAQALWPTKTAEELASRTNTSVRMAKYWLARRYDISADDLTALLRSEEGLKSSKQSWGARARSGGGASSARRSGKRSANRSSSLSWSWKVWMRRTEHDVDSEAARGLLRLARAQAFAPGTILDPHFGLA